MKTSLIAGAIALSLGAGSANALIVDITEMVWPGYDDPYVRMVEGSLTSDGTGYLTGPDPFGGQPWSFDAVAFFAADGANTWSVSGSNNVDDAVAYGPATFNFDLAANQVAWGLYWDWNANYDVPTLNIMTCTSFTIGATCEGIFTPMVTDPFAGLAPVFSGVISAVPIPGAAWLLGSGLVGLTGIARRRKQS